MSKRILDIEVALAWAYREELLRQSAAPGVWERMRVVHESGGRTEPSSWPVDAGWIGEVHPDAKVIEAAVDGPLADIARAAREQSASVAVYDEGLSILDDMRGFGLDEVPAIRRAIGQVRETVITHARLATRPPTESRTACMPRRHDRGQVVVVRDVTGWQETVDGRHVAIPCQVAAPQNGGHYRRGAYCPLAWDPEPRVILADRADFIAWRAALDFLADELKGALDSIEVLPPAAPQRPWMGERDARAPTRVLPDLRLSTWLRESPRAMAGRKRRVA